MMDTSSVSQLACAHPIWGFSPFKLTSEFSLIKTNNEVKLIVTYGKKDIHCLLTQAMHPN